MTHLPCERFDELLPDYLEASLAAAEHEAADRHRGACARCAALVADLEAIGRSAASLPTLRPERDLWAGIAERIDTSSIVPLDVRRGARHGVGRPSVTFTRRWLGVAAAALVAATSAITYSVARVSGNDADTTRVARAVAGGPAPSAAVPTPLAATPSASTAPTVVDSPTAPRPTADAPRDARLASAAGAGSRPGDAAAEYDREIVALRAVVRQRRADLDTSTVRVLEESLRVIDRAIAQSRAALARDPASQFLGEQLTRALDSKVELLRTAALLPARGA